MTESQEIGGSLFEVLCFIGVLPVILIIAVGIYWKVVLPFMKEREYILTELERAYDDEYSYWERRLRRLYIRSIPLVGPLIWSVVRKII